MELLEGEYDLYFIVGKVVLLFFIKYSDIVQLYPLFTHCLVFIIMRCFNFVKNRIRKDNQNKVNKIIILLHIELVVLHLAHDMHYFLNKIETTPFIGILEEVIKHIFPHFVSIFVDCKKFKKSNVENIKNNENKLKEDNQVLKEENHVLKKENQVLKESLGISEKKVSNCITYLVESDEKMKLLEDQNEFLDKMTHEEWYNSPEAVDECQKDNKKKHTSPRENKTK